MTAEIAVMNKEAIALATDSAVTIGDENNRKIFTSANKLFALSKYYPVGIMVYGNADFMGIPWETIIKIYRNDLGEKKFNTLKEYADEFITFLGNGNLSFSEEQQKRYLFWGTYGYFTLIKDNIIERVNKVIIEKGSIPDTQVKQIISNVIKEHYDNLKNEFKMLPSIPESNIKNIIDKYVKIIDKAKEKVFEELPISTDSLKQLREISASLFSKDIFSDNISGVVIAGFGEKDIFPSLKSFDIEGIVNNKLKYRERAFIEVTFEKSATIIPFAQIEMVKTFMEGIDPFLKEQTEGYLSQIFNKYPEIIVDNIESLNENEKQTLKQKIKETTNEIIKDYKNRLEVFKRDNYIEPVIRVVSMLPKDELAAMAESLVSLTSFKRKVSIGAETVGGPIDVAVISKGDGFIWIKRKHYFKAELNSQFFSNYFRR